jgi:hypothetical protein
LKEKASTGDADAIAKIEARRACDTALKAASKAKWVNENATRFESSDSYGFTDFYTRTAENIKRLLTCS